MDLSATLPPVRDEDRSWFSFAEPEAIRISRTGNLANVDPYGFTTDDVVRVFRGILDDEDLDRLRDNHVTGYLLLSFASIQQLKADYGIWRLGTRSKIMSIVMKLRRNSNRFRELAPDWTPTVHEPPPIAQLAYPTPIASPLITPFNTLFNALPADLTLREPPSISPLPVSPPVSPMPNHTPYAFPFIAPPTATAQLASPPPFQIVPTRQPTAAASQPVRRYSPFPPLRLFERDFPLVIDSPIRRDDGRPFWADKNGDIYEPEIWTCDDGVTRIGSVAITDEEELRLTQAGLMDARPTDDRPSYTRPENQAFNPAAFTAVRSNPLYRAVRKTTTPQDRLSLAREVSSRTASPEPQSRTLSPDPLWTGFSRDRGSADQESSPDISYELGSSRTVLAESTTLSPGPERAKPATFTVWAERAQPIQN